MFLTKYFFNYCEVEWRPEQPQGVKYCTYLSSVILFFLFVFVCYT